MKEINFRYWLAFTSITIEEAILLLANEDPSIWTPEIPTEYHLFAKMVMRAVGDRQIETILNKSQFTIEDRISTNSLIKFIIQNKLEGNRFAEACKIHAIEMNLNRVADILYIDEDKTTSRRDARMVFLSAKNEKTYLMVDDFSMTDQHNAEKPKSLKSFIVDRILSINI